MNLINNITDQTAQTFSVTLADGSRATINLAYWPQQLGWYYDVTWSTGPFPILGRRVVTSPNMLRQFRNQIPFGLMVITTDNQEPINQDDFSTGYAQMILLDQDDIATIEATIYPGLP